MKRAKNKACRMRRDRVKPAPPLRREPVPPLPTWTEKQKIQVLFTGSPKTEDEKTLRVSTVVLAPDLKMVRSAADELKLFYEADKSVSITLGKLIVLSKTNDVPIPMGLFGWYRLHIDDTQQKLLRDFFQLADRPLLLKMPSSWEDASDVPAASWEDADEYEYGVEWSWE